ncbi:uncharacterized protein [Fopius arisanus]|uniref:Uncharacterized protein n=1 Tax=Fopius arisanus TaxID=64838 RepID=A0A9R1T2X0_9HYME|nr:PREDICTED: uncharacterized protein LOC105265756 [Fopius arisanus]
MRLGDASARGHPSLSQIPFAGGPLAVLQQERREDRRVSGGPQVSTGDEKLRGRIRGRVHGSCISVEIVRVPAKEFSRPSRCEGDDPGFRIYMETVQLAEAWKVSSRLISLSLDFLIDNAIAGRFHFS